MNKERALPNTLTENRFVNAQIMASKITMPIEENPNGSYHVNPLDDKSVRNWEILGLYLSNHSSLDKIGRKYSISGQRIRQLGARGTVRLWYSGNQEFRQEFPFTRISWQRSEFK